MAVLCAFVAGLLVICLRVHPRFGTSGSGDATRKGLVFDWCILRLRAGRRLKRVHIYIYIYIYVYVHIYIYIYM